MKRAIINVAVGSWYPRGQRRMYETLQNVGYAGDTLFWNDRMPPGCPDHNDMMYGFKAYALEMARAMGYGPALWCDASTWFLHNPEPIFERIERDGYYLWRNPCEDLGESGADIAMLTLGMDREESFGLPSAVATVFGLDLSSKVGSEVLTRYGRAARDGAFNAPPHNDPNGPSWVPGLRSACGSTDPRVKSCRQDQTVLGIIAHQMGLVVDDRVPARLIGYPSMPHADDVILLAEDDGGVSLDTWEATGYLKR